MTFAIREILPLVGPHAFHGDAGHRVAAVVPLADAASRTSLADAVVWVGDKNLAAFPKTPPGPIGLLIVSPAGYERLRDRAANFLVVAEPRRVFSLVLSAKFARKLAPKIEPSAWIDPSARVGERCYVGRNVVIEAGVRIGADCVVLHNTVIHEGTVIGDRVRIGSNCTIGHAGFGYERNASGDYERIPHIGRVRMEDDVHVHSNTCIDRAVVGETVIGRNVKIDNLVHVAHGVTIGENSLVIANSMIGGSVKIGRDCWIAPSTSIKNKIDVADETLAGLGCVVLKDTVAKSVMIGNPAIEMDEYKRWSKLKEQLYLNFGSDLR